jgi:Spy/CpxP family protein refolding chaperone
MVMKRRTMVTVAAISVVVLGLGAAAIGAWAHGAGGVGAHGWMMKRMVSAMLDEALDKANVSAEQRAAIHASRDRAFAAFDGQRGDHDTQREQVLAMFEADRVDPAQLETLHARMEEHRRAMRTAVTQAIVEIHGTLTPEQRKVVAQFVRDHRPGGPGGWR